MRTVILSRWDNTTQMFELVYITLIYIENDESQLNWQLDCETSFSEEEIYSLFFHFKKTAESKLSSTKNSFIKKGFKVMSDLTHG